MLVFILTTVHYTAAVIHVAQQVGAKLLYTFFFNRKILEASGKVNKIKILCSKLVPREFGNQATGKTGFLVLKKKNAFLLEKWHTYSVAMLRFSSSSHTSK